MPETKNPTTEWQSGDPRGIGKVKQMKIIIWTGQRAVNGVAENHHADYVELDSAVYVASCSGGSRSLEMIYADEKWPEHWLWCLPPKKEG